MVRICSYFVGVVIISHDYNIILCMIFITWIICHKLEVTPVSDYLLIGG
jgi:hypothetical protein